MNIITVENERAAIGLAQAHAIVGYHGTPEQAAANYRARFGVDADTVYTWQVGAGGKTAQRCGIACTREAWEAQQVMKL